MSDVVYRGLKIAQGDFFCFRDIGNLLVIYASDPGFAVVKYDGEYSWSHSFAGNIIALRSDDLKLLRISYVHLYQWLKIKALLGKKA